MAQTLDAGRSVMVQTYEPSVWLIAQRATYSPTTNSVRFEKVFRSDMPQVISPGAEIRLLSEWSTSVDNLNTETAIGIEGLKATR